MVSSIFGYNGYPGWIIKSISRKRSPRDFESVFSFLSVGGVMFGLIQRLDQEHLKYAFPMKCLPVIDLIGRFIKNVLS